MNPLLTYFPEWKRELWQPWRDDAACAGRAHEMSDPRRAKALCRNCPVLAACRAWADRCAAHGEDRSGEVLAGETPSERGARRRTTPSPPEGNAA
ncbi:hypothetical protein GCM10010466_39680 [Planomonospora alba]|uniref:4Fe-4S Wbl-type domain-containing protein n=1 Tax=Planomonospora alba TaxID=161354 RepID=A0ABP6NDX2_9ACTN